MLVRTGSEWVLYEMQHVEKMNHFFITEIMERKKEVTKSHLNLMKEQTRFCLDTACWDFLIKFGMILLISIFCMVRIIQLNDETKAGVYINILSGVIGYFLPSPVAYRTGDTRAA